MKQLEQYFRDLDTEGMSWMNIADRVQKDHGVIVDEAHLRKYFKEWGIVKKPKSKKK